MDAQFSDRLKTVLADPDAMATIAGLAQRFAGQKDGAPPSSDPAGSAPPGKSAMEELLGQPVIASALHLLGEGSRERLALLQAMRPFVKPEKREKLDRIIRTMKSLDLLVSAQKLL